MPQVEVQRISAPDDRTLPVFADLERVADLVRLEAYNLFARRGAGDGHALDDWLAAEKQFCWPSAELEERDGGYTLKVALAGYEPRDITVTATPSEVIVRAAHEHKAKSGDGGVRWSEFGRNDVLRRVTVPAALDVGKTTATFKNGLLEVEMTKAHAAESPRKVEVAAGARAEAASP